MKEGDRVSINLSLVHSAQEKTFAKYKSIVGVITGMPRKHLAAIKWPEGCHLTVHWHTSCLTQDIANQPVKPTVRKDAKNG